MSNVVVYTFHEEQNFIFHSIRDTGYHGQIIKNIYESKTIMIVVIVE
jgi:hypothetical protein